jgi:hypothetical protein
VAAILASGENGGEEQGLRVSTRLYDVSVEGASWRVAAGGALAEEVRSGHLEKAP